MPEDILLFSEEPFPNGKEQPDLPTQDATYGLLTCVINVSVQAGVTVGLHLWHVHKIKVQNMNPFNTRKSSDWFFYDISIKMDRIYIHFPRFLQVTHLLFPSPPSRDRNFKNK